MGYYVNTAETKIFLDKKHFNSVYERMCELNDHDDLKRGGRHPKTEEYTTRYNPNVWFSWMDYNYPETCSDMFAILTALGFEYRLDIDGNLVDLIYSDKIGNEDYFLTCFSGYIEPGSYITYQGEDGTYWRYVFTDKDMVYQNGYVEVNFVDEYTHEFGKPSPVDTLLQQEIENLKIYLEGEIDETAE